MSRLGQIGVFNMVLGGVVLFLGLFPSAVDADVTPGIGLIQILSILSGLMLLVLGAYVITHALMHQDGAQTLLSSIGIRLGLTGMIFSGAVTLADAMGYGSHTGNPVFGWLQTIGILIGFGIAAVGVLIYGMGGSQDIPTSAHQ